MGKDRGKIEFRRRASRAPVAHHTAHGGHAAGGHRGKLGARAPLGLRDYLEPMFARRNHWVDSHPLTYHDTDCPCGDCTALRAQRSTP